MKTLDKSIVMIGFQSSGKTTVGKLLANTLKCSFIDTDEMIEKEHPNLNCHEIYCLFGEKYFRQLESQIIHSFQLSSPVVIAIGGGSLIQKSNVSFLKSLGFFIYLKTSAKILKNRLWQRHTLPGYFNHENWEESFTKHYKERTLIYEKWADHIIEMDTLNENEAMNGILREI